MGSIAQLADGVGMDGDATLAVGACLGGVAWVAGNGGARRDAVHSLDSVRERRARALAALQAAELRTGVKSVRNVGFDSRARVLDSRSEKTSDLAFARQQFRAPAAAAVGGEDCLAQGINPGSVASVRGSTSLLLSLLSASVPQGAWAAVVGMPDLGVLAASELGLNIERLALVPAPGPDAPAVIAALLDGVPGIAVGPEAKLLEKDRRQLAARVRERGAVLLSSQPWPGAHLNLEVTQTRWRGTSQGAGWLREVELVVRRTGRGAAARPAMLRVAVPLPLPKPTKASEQSAPPSAIRRCA